jgi:hypothetical protein
LTGDVAESENIITLRNPKGNSSGNEMADLKDIQIALGALADSSQHLPANSAENAEMLKDQLIDTVQGIAVLLSHRTVPLLTKLVHLHKRRPEG